MTPQIPSPVLTESGSMGMISARIIQAPLFEIYGAKVEFRLEIAKKIDKTINSYSVI